MCWFSANLRAGFISRGDLWDGAGAWARRVRGIEVLARKVILVALGLEVWGDWVRYSVEF